MAKDSLMDAIDLGVILDQPDPYRRENARSMSRDRQWENTGERERRVVARVLFTLDEWKVRDL